MLPFLKPKNVASVIMAKTKPEGGVEDEHKEDEPDPALSAAAEDMLHAINSKDSVALAAALESVFMILESREAPAMEQDDE